MAYRSNPQQVAAQSPSPPPRINFESLHISPLPCPPEASEQAWSFRCQRSRQVNKSWPKTFLFNIDIILMIKGKYKQVQIIKDSGYKIVQKCVRQDGSHYIVKSYAQHEAKLVQNQIHTYQKLKQPHLHGFPQIKEAFETNQRTYLVFEELGENIETLRQRCGGRFTLKTVIAISLQLLERIEYLHHHEIIHGDVKPSNFLVGKGKMKHKIYLTDFELSTSYIKNGKHVPQEFREKFSGSLRFSSRAANSRLALCRKDDLQSLLYSMIFLVKGELPWMKINSTDMIAANEQLLSLKSNSRQQLLSGLPQAFRQAFTHIDQLKFTSAPDYNRIKKLFNDLARKHGYEKDYKYDWEYL